MLNQCQFIRRTAAILLAFGLIPGLLPGFADRAPNGKFAASIVPLDEAVLVGKPVRFRLSNNPGNPHWKLGDGATAEGSSVTHTYQEPGIYRVVMGAKVGETFNELSSAIVRVHTPETVHLPQVLLDTDAASQDDKSHLDPPGLIRSSAITTDYLAESRKFTGILSMAVSPGGRLRAMAVADTVPAFMNPPEYVGPAIGEWAVTNRATHMVSSMAVTPGGRLWVTWYVSMTGGENEHNYVVLSTSGDDGATWEEVLVIDPDGPGPVRAFDPEIWISPDGKLRVYWAQTIGHDGTISGTWEIVTADPESSSPKWRDPRRLADGIMMCKPIALSTGEWVLPISTWRHTDYSARMVVSSDKGETWKVRGAANVPVEMRNFDEHMFIERRDGSIWMLVRTRYKSGWTVSGHPVSDTPGINGIGESISTDRGVTWPEVTPLTGIPHPNARFFITRLQSGNLLLVKHGPMDERLEVRSHLMAFISKDDGHTWQGGLLLDEREGISYPDGQQAENGTIYITYDRGRSTAREILFATFREEDALAGEAVTGAVRLQQLVSKGSGGLRSPTEVRASASSSSQINLSWSDQSSNETGFIIERRTGTSGTWDQIATVGANITSFNDAGLSSGTQYFYRVRAYFTSSLGNLRHYSRTPQDKANEANATTQADY